MLKEFKEFATRGNIMDMAIGVIIGGAFQKIVTSLVNDIIMPTVAIFTGKVDFSDLAFTIGSASIKYGSFITAIIDFLIILPSVLDGINSRLTFFGRKIITLVILSYFLNPNPPRLIIFYFHVIYELVISSFCHF